MSHFTTIKTNFKDEQSLVTAITKVFGIQPIIAEEQQALTGYFGVASQQKANIIVKIPNFKSDLGFIRENNGIYSAIYDGYEINNCFLKSLAREYAVICAMRFATKNGMQITTTRNREDGRLELRLRQQQQIGRR